MVAGRPQIGDWDTFDELMALQDKQIPEVLKRATQSPFYAERFRDLSSPVTADDFDDLPLTSKEDLFNSYPFGMLAVAQEELATYFESSSSGGHPTPAYYTDKDFQDLIERYARKSIGIYPSDILLVRSPYALGLAAHVTHQTGRFCGATIVPGDMRSSVIPYPRVVRVLHDLNVTLAWSNPTDCLLWAATAQRRGLDPATDFPKLRGLFVGGEPLSPARRERISQIWGGIPTLEEYGCTEVGSLAGVCSRDRLHFWADRIKAEVHDPETGTVRSEGIGELVLTPLYVEAMPLVRYNIRDWVELKNVDCECGWKLPTIQVLGRAGQGFPVGDDGTRITQLHLENVVFSLPAELGVLFWRARADLDLLQVQIEADDGKENAAKIALIDAVGTEFGVSCEVQVLSPGGLVADEVIVTPRQSLKPRSLFGPGESWEQAIVFPNS